MAKNIYHTNEEVKKAARQLVQKYFDGYKLSDIHPYTDKEGLPLFWRIRLDHPIKGKRISPLSFNGSEWVLKEPKFPKGGKPLYRLHEIISRPDETVWVVEGEKCADALAKLGLLATTSGSANSAEGADWSELFGRKAIFWQDNDQPGLKYAKEVTGKLLPQDCGVQWVDISKLRWSDDTSGEDAVDWIESNPRIAREDIEALPKFPVNGLNSLNSFYSHWGEIENFKNNDLPEIPAELLPGNYGKFAKALAVATEVPEGLVVFGVLGAVSAAISHRFCVSPKDGWDEPINIYLLAALPPGNNKSSVLKACSKPLVTWEKEQAEKLGPKIKQAISERKTMEKVIEKERNLAMRSKDHDFGKLEIHEIAEMEAKLEDPPVLPQIFVTDTTPEALVSAVAVQGGRFAILSDEGGIMEVISGLYTGGKANINIILNGIDGGYVRVERKDKSFDLSPYLTFCLFAQPIVISCMGGKQAFAGKGLLERFLYLLPQSNLGYRTHDTEPVSKVLRDGYNLQILDLLNMFMFVGEGENERFVLTLDEQSHKAWKLFQIQTEKELRPDGKLSPIAGWGGKISGFALRFAGLIHVMKRKDVDSRIDHETMVSALTLATHLKEHALAAFGLMNIDEATQKAVVVLEWIKANGEHTFLRSKCHKALHGQFEDVGELREVLDILKERNIVNGPEKVTINGKGRPSIIYHVNPAIFSDVN
jgi:hypothetical protein